MSVRRITANDFENEHLHEKCECRNIKCCCEHKKCDCGCNKCDCGRKKCDCKHKKDYLKEYIKTHHAKAIVLSCIDYRFVDVMIRYLEEGRLAQKYDVTAVAGSSLGFNQREFKHWPQTIRDQIDLAIELHHIKQVVVFDHMDCGAYSLFYPHIRPNSKEEKALHIKNIGEFIKKINLLYPKLICTGYLIHTDNKIELIEGPK